MRFLGRRQQDLLKRVVEVKSKKPKVSNTSNGNNVPVLKAMPSGKSDADKEKETLRARSSEAGDRKIDNPRQNQEIIRYSAQSAVFE
ncbi:hypothetical protein K7X08_035027 [Anisodus acutangulus]|uniref:Uncharacterized protein n=1 Tax=Anisodus acutangulus TaxID=402998 RepID=A0A9Q1R1Z5_9SOLA|nr:hypothetical protein K7X08_035027 [Anisodus acutangulus]